MRNRQDNGFTRVHHVGIRCRHLVTGHDDGAIRLPRVIDEKFAVVRELRMKRQSQQSTLGARHDLFRQIQEYRRRARIRLHDQDPAALLENKQTSGTVVRIGHECRGSQPCIRDRMQVYMRCLRRTIDREEKY